MSIRNFQPLPPTDVLTALEASEYLRISRRTLWDLTRSGDIPSKRVARQWRYDRRRLQEYMTRPEEEAQ